MREFKCLKLVLSADSKVRSINLDGEVISLDGPCSECGEKKDDVAIYRSIMSGVNGTDFDPEPHCGACAEKVDADLVRMEERWAKEDLAPVS